MSVVDDKFRVLVLENRFHRRFPARKAIGVFIRNELYCKDPEVPTVVLPFNLDMCTPPCNSGTNSSTRAPKAARTIATTSAPRFHVASMCCITFVDVLPGNRPAHSIVITTGSSSSTMRHYWLRVGTPSRLVSSKPHWSTLPACARQMKVKTMLSRPNPSLWNWNQRSSGICSVK
jgi:hypothetical protein